MRLLFEDMLDRKYRWPSALIILGVAVFWWGTSVSPRDTLDLREAFVASLMFVFAMGPLVVAAAPEPTPLWYLPVSRRDRWRATWLMATVVPTTAMIAAKLLALLFSWGSNWLDFLSALALSSVLDFAYAGVACGLMLAVTALRPTGGRVRRYLSGLGAVVIGIAVLGGGFFWPLVLRNLLPLRWSDLSPLSAALLAAALGVSVAIYFHTPPPSVHGQRAHPRTRASRVSVDAGLTGLPQLLLHEYRFSLGLGGFLVVTCGFLLFIAARVMDSPDSLGGLLRMQSLLLFDVPVVHQRRPFDLMIWYALFATTLVARFPEILTHLRALPIAAWRLNLIMVAWPALILATVWTGLIGVHFLVLGRPIESLQFPLFVALAGSSALMQAATIRWPGASGINALTLIVVSLVYLADGGAHPWMAILGLAAIAASATANHFTLMRASTYKRAAAAFADASARTWS